MKRTIEDNEFVNLINENRIKLYKTAMAILKNSEDVNDAIQETILSAYNNIYSLKEKESFVAWIITILRNKCYDIIRKNKKVVSFDGQVIDNSDKYYDNYKVESSLERIINQLDKDLREITVLYYYDELDVKEIANIIRIPEGTVKSRLSRAREKIRYLIEKEGEENERY